jgi:RimJ/RimL family protein N-acetyltransferase
MLRGVPVAETIKIRHYRESDAPELYAAVRESLAELSQWMPWAHAEYTLADAANWIGTTQNGHADGSMYDFAIVSGDGRYLGGCGLNQISRFNAVANLGYWVRTSATGRGVAVRAVKLLSDWALRNTDLNRLEILAAVENVRSQRVAEKAGAHRDGVLKKRLMLHGRTTDAVLYSLIRPG